MRNSVEIGKHTSKQSILDFCNMPKFNKELIDFIEKSRAYTMDKLINLLVTVGKLKLELSNKAKSSKQRYVQGEK